MILMALLYQKEDLKTLRKNDWVVKRIAVLQPIWFRVQTLLLAIQQYQITAFERPTLLFLVPFALMEFACTNQKTSNIL